VIIKKSAGNKRPVVSQPISDAAEWHSLLDEKPAVKLSNGARLVQGARRVFDIDAIDDDEEIPQALATSAPHADHGGSAHNDGKPPMDVEGAVACQLIHWAPLSAALRVKAVARRASIGAPLNESKGDNVRNCQLMGDFDTDGGAAPLSATEQSDAKRAEQFKREAGGEAKSHQRDIDADALNDPNLKVNLDHINGHDAPNMTPGERDSLLARMVYGQQRAEEDRADDLRNRNTLEIHKATANEEHIKAAIEQFWCESTHPHKTRFDIVHSELTQNSAKYFGTNPPYPLGSTTSLGKIKKVIAGIRRQQKAATT
jgi:hypothetical protein